jgi:hypothetical protein
MGNCQPKMSTRKMMDLAVLPPSGLEICVWRRPIVSSWPLEVLLFIVPLRQQEDMSTPVDILMAISGSFWEGMKV